MTPSAAIPHRHRLYLGDGTPLISLLGVIREQLTDESARWVHHGATTQDAVDTASMLQLKAGLAVLDRCVSSVAGRLADLAEAHLSTPMMARTFLQLAQPTTFGVRVAQWLEPLVRGLIDLREVATSLPVQLGGPVGNLAPFGEDATRVVEALATELGLEVPVIPWHSDRSHVISPVAVAETIAITMGKIGTDLVLLTQSEVAEVKMRPAGHRAWTTSAIRSTRFGRWRRPMPVAPPPPHCEAAMDKNSERGVGGWHLEWWAVPLVFQAAAASVEAIDAALASLEVDTERMTSRAEEIDAATLAAAAALVAKVLDATREVCDANGPGNGGQQRSAYRLAVVRRR